MSFVDFKEVTSNNVGTAIRYGGNDLKEFMQILNGKVVADKRPRILNEWLWLDHFDMTPPTSAPGSPTDTNASRIYVDPTDFRIKIKKTAGTIIDLENVNIPSSALAQITDKAKLPASIAYEDEANVFTAAQTFNESQTVNKAAQASAAEIIATWKVSDGQSKIEILNASAVDAIFSPWIRSYNLDSTTPALYFYGYIGNALDTGGEAGMRFDVRKNDNSTLTTRPLFSFRNAGNEVFAIGQTSINFSQKDMANVNAITSAGLLFVNKTSQASAAESILTFKVSDSALSQVLLINASAVDGVFVPWMQFWQRDVSTQPAYYNYGYIDAAHDTGTTPIAIYDVRKSDGATIATRPTFEWRISAATMMKMNANGDLLVTPRAQSGVAEVLQEWRPADVNSYLRLINASPTDARFTPMIRGRQVEDATLPGLAVEARCEVAHDTGSAAVGTFDARTHSDTAITTRPLFDFRTAGVVKLRINPKGDILQTITAVASAGELVHRWQISDNATAYFQLQNASATNATFAPQLTSYNYSAGTTNHGFQLRTYVRSTEDSGTTPVTIFDSRLDTEAALVVRNPIFRFRNAGDTLLDITSAGLNLGALYMDYAAMAAPANPGAGVRRLFMDTATSELSVRTSAGTTVSLETGGGGGGALDDLTDVVITTPLDNQALVYDTASGNWINEAQTGGGGGGDVFLGATNTYGDFNSLFRSARLIVRNPANTFSYLLAGAAITADRTITFPLLAGNDVAVTEAFAQTLTNKTIAAGSNTISGIVDANISAHTSTKITITAKAQLNSTIPYTDQANTFGAFFQQFPSGRLTVRDSDGSHAYIFAGGNITADRTVSLPVLAGDDTFDMIALAQTLTNKTINTTDNTVTATSQATGDILTNNGTKFVRKARGTALQVLRVNSGATDVEWGTLDNEKVGKSTANGNASTTVFNIAHGTGSNPTYAFAICSSQNIHMTYTTDATNIICTFATAPGSGTNNVVIYWIVVS